MDDIYEEFNILVMDTFVRRIKSLIAINIGAHIVHSAWIEECLERKKIIDIKGYELKINKDI